MKTRTEWLVIVLSFMVGAALYVLAVFPTFTFAPHSYDYFLITVFTLMAGLGALALGYESVVVFGGFLSLRFADFTARVTRSKHAIEVIENYPQSISSRFIEDAFMLYVPAIIFTLVFTLVFTLAWDIHNLHDPQTSFFHPLFHALDAFARPTSVDPVQYAVDVVPVMIVLIALAGITPSLVVPYFRKFKITGVNSGPFHTNLLFTVVGFVVGLSAILTLIGQVYKVLWAGQGPYYYHYVIPAMLGLSLHYSIGSLLGRNRSENMVQTKLEKSSCRRIIKGTVNINQSD